MTLPAGLDAVVVGSGPNGLAAAITLARAGRSVRLYEAAETIGGGLRSESFPDGLGIRDICAAVHPLGVASPFFTSLELSKYGLAWVHPPAPLAHPLENGTALVLHRSLQATRVLMGIAGDRYCRLMSFLVGNWDNMIVDVLRPLHVPRHPFLYGRFGRAALKSIDATARQLFENPGLRGLFAGLAAHGVMPFDRSGGAAPGIILGAAAHAVGWPIARGGSQSIAIALAACLKENGGEIVTGTSISSLKDLPAARMYLFDVTPRQFANIAAEKIPPGYRERLLRHRYGPGVFKIDWVLSGPIPWNDENCLRAGTVHLGGEYRAIAQAEQEVWAGRHPNRPFVILSQPSLFDATRATPGRHIAWAYCHVPNGSTVDMTARIEAQIERFAHGFQDSILQRCAMSPADMEKHNPNYIGGDIAGGEQNIIRLLFRPLGQWKPYVTPVNGMYICSSSMPPGSGAHGMCGHLAALQAIKVYG
jgi:phytoene dehydrogenase-like protein